MLAAPAASVTSTLAAPGTDPSSARLAEWARGHHLGFAVTSAEELSYRLHPPRTGGAPDARLLAEAAAAPGAGAPGGAGAAPGLHTPLAPLAGAALPGEGHFRAVVGTAADPAVQVAYVRPDAVHTSYLAAVVVLSAGRLRFVQHPGYADPGHLGWWSQHDRLVGADRAGLAATFNGGFKLADARGGYYADGRTVGRLVPGAASLVVHRDGHADVGTWGVSVGMGPDVVSVRQNLQLLVDGGWAAASAEASTQSDWGATIGGADAVWRSGVGVTAGGDLVYVAGAALSAGSLAHVLQRAGAVRAMQLDINPEWVSGMWYSPADGGDAVPHEVLRFARPADRYWTASSRDFVAAYLR